MEFIVFVKQRLDELEYTSLITEWNSNMDKDARKKQEKEKRKHQGKKSITNLAGITGQIVLSKSFCGSYFRMFLVYGQEYVRTL